jgi:phenylacetic acid degradation operon negative regulatory protein
LVDSHYPVRPVPVGEADCSDLPSEARPVPASRAAGWQTAVVHARSALFDLYGDHLRTRGGSAPVAALVRLLAPLGIAAPAVRTAVSRMVRQDWLTPVRLGAAPGYALTTRAARRLDAAANRIYRTREPGWDGTWHVVVTRNVDDRSVRQRLRTGLGFLGYAQLDTDTWISPRSSDELDTVLTADEVRAERFLARHDGDPASLVRQAWDLAALAKSYEAWLDRATELIGREVGTDQPERAFAVRSELVHEWRKFLFTDPALPRALLPEPWPGDAAAAYFDTQAERLLPLATRFVDETLTGSRHHEETA